MISIIVPTFNYGRFIRDCIESVLSQSIADWECIVVDNASTDDTAQIVTQYTRQDSRIKYCKLDDNKGPSCARNVGIQLSKGEYILFLDSDDLIGPKKLESALVLFERNPSSSIVYSDMRYFEDGKVETLYFRMSLDTTIDSPWMSYQQGGKEEMLPSLLQSNQMVISSPIVKKSAVDQVGFFDESLLHYEDWEFWLRCAFDNKEFLFDPCEMSYALVRVHRNSHSSNNTLKMLVGSARIGVRYQNKVSDFRQRIQFKLKTWGSRFLIDQLLFKGRNDWDYLRQSLSFLVRNFPNKSYNHFLTLLNEGRESALIKRLKYYYTIQYIKFILTKKLCQLFLSVSRPTNK
jgi:glycosyltransferase involved in cell wall biosynthesis